MTVLQIDTSTVRVRIEPDDSFVVFLPDTFGGYRPATRQEALLLKLARPELRDQLLVPGDQCRRFAKADRDEGGRR